ncbi:MAG: hypothetical protein ACM3N4_00715 [Nitrososphaerota archaeon]
MTTPPATMPPSPMETPTTQASPRATRPSRFGLFFGIITAVVCLGAIALAIFAPALTSAPKLQVPQGWQQVYNDNPSNTTSAWNNAENSFGCSLPAAGLNVASDSTCVFTPSSGVTLADGVLVVARIAPAADVPLSQDAGILLDNSVLVIMSQQGDYTICQDTCDRTSGVNGSVVTGSTIAWHADAFVPNELAVLYDASQQTVNFYVNGQYVDHISASLSTTPSVALTTSSNGQALFTHVAIYAGSVA